MRAAAKRIVSVLGIRVGQEQRLAERQVAERVVAVRFVDERVDHRLRSLAAWYSNAPMSIRPPNTRPNGVPR